MVDEDLQKEYDKMKTENDEKLRELIIQYDNLSLHIGQLNLSLRMATNKYEQLGSEIEYRQNMFNIK